MLHRTLIRRRISTILVGRCWLPRRVSIALAALLVAGLSHDARAADPNPSSGWEYVSPVPGSNFVSRFNNLILRPGESLNAANLRSFRVVVTGSMSGTHSGSLELSDDDRTMTFQPDLPFTPSEVVTVTVGHLPDAPPGGPPGSGPSGSAAWAGDENGPRQLRFAFTVSPIEEADSDLAIRASLDAETASSAPEDATGMALGAIEATSEDEGGALAALPTNFPTTTLLHTDHPDPGYIYLSPFSPLASDPGHLLIVDEYAKPIFYHQLYVPATDLKRESDGRIVYFTRATLDDPTPAYYVMSDAGVVTDRITAGNGYVTDSHELRFLPNGHILLMSYDPQPVRMDLVVPGGRANASVIGLVVQELDRARRVVFQWRSWDHFSITDTNSPLATLTGPEVDYVHGNAIGIEANGDLLISSRHLNEITRVSRRTGDVVWRMAPNGRHNDFTFLDDPRGFSHQHDVRRQPDGHLTLFDNGNYLLPAYSRGVEYELDEANRTVHLVWQYRRSPTVYGSFMGSVQRLEGGGSLIGWGGVTGVPKVTETRADGSVAWEIGFTRSNIWTYRAFRGDWRTSRLAVDRTSLHFEGVDPGPPVEQTVTITNPGPDPVTLNYFTTAGSPAFEILVFSDVPLAPGQSFAVPIQFNPAFGFGDHAGKAYLGFTTSKDVIVQDIALTAVSAPRLATAPAGESALRREDARATDAVGSGLRYALASAGRVRVEVFDLRGRHVATPLDAWQAAGEHAIEWNAEREPAGVYFARIVTPEGTITRRIAHLR